ncbi:hypothetical protein QOZ80_1BG0084010 [Eleusine coracana subsp. coracana]|nr:hypothetical protein QOZ80_1BG0084010 [Eleusine coracana subsp. coracana]
MDTARCVACYRQWIAGQESGLGELEAASANAASGLATDADLRAAVDRCMAAYQDYAARRRALSLSRDAAAPAFFSPPWCTAFENSVLWLDGCRPTLAIRLLYSLCGEGLEAQLDEFINGDVAPVQAGMGMGMGMGVTAAQLALVNELHQRTLRQEGALTERLATLQEDIADRPLLPIVRERERERATATVLGAAGAVCDDGFVGRVGVAAAAGPGGVVVDAEVDAAMESYRAGLARLLAEADELRMATARALVTEILTPRQALEMLMAAKQLHLSVRDWSRRREAGSGQLEPARTTVTAASSSAAVCPVP